LPQSRLLTAAVPTLVRANDNPDDKQSAAKSQAKFHTSDRCLACHNGLSTPQAKTFPLALIGVPASWPTLRAILTGKQAFRETIDHPESRAMIEDECSTCHMPIAHLEQKKKGA